MQSLDQLRLLHLADSALPIGALAHSFGLETLAGEGLLRVEDLEPSLAAYLTEVGTLEAAFCQAGHALGGEFQAPEWLGLNRRLSALKPARETRTASAMLGRRLLTLVAGLDDSPAVENALRASREASSEIHHCIAFGLAGGALTFDAESTVLAYLHQAVAGLISACQRLLPLGQVQAGQMLWRLKAIITQVAAASRDQDPRDAACFAPLLEIASMRHPALATRLFIS